MSTQNKLVDKLTSIGGKVTEYTQDDCCGCGLTFSIKELHRIRFGLVEIDIRMQNKERELCMPVTDFVICNKCIARSFIRDRRQLIRSMQHTLGLEYLTPIGITKPKEKKQIHGQPKWGTATKKR